MHCGWRKWAQLWGWCYQLCAGHPIVMSPSNMAEIKVAQWTVAGCPAACHTLHFIHKWCVFNDAGDDRISTFCFSIFVNLALMCRTQGARLTAHSPSLCRFLQKVASVKSWLGSWMLVSFLFLPILSHFKSDWLQKLQSNLMVIFDFPIHTFFLEGPLSEVQIMGSFNLNSNIQNIRTWQFMVGATPR